MRQKEQKFLLMKNPRNDNMPPWARRIDDYGKTHWHHDKKWSKRRGEYITSIIFNLIFLWIVNKIPEWKLSFIRDNFSAVLWILNMNLLIQIGGNTLMLLIDHPAIRYLSRMILEASGFITMIVLFFIYPFNFSHLHHLAWIDKVLPILLIIGMVISALKVFSNLWKLIFWRE